MRSHYLTPSHTTALHHNLIHSQVRELQEVRSKLVAQDSANMMLVRSEAAAVERAAAAAAELARKRQEMEPLQARNRCAVRLTFFETVLHECGSLKTASLFQL